jgi:hypothetical protein
MGGPISKQGCDTPAHRIRCRCAGNRPNTATGLDGALKTLGAQPYGAALLIGAGLGIITYGLYSFAMARYTKM